VVSALRTRTSRRFLIAPSRCFFAFPAGC
jgi:hypothetical protein